MKKLLLSGLICAALSSGAWAGGYGHPGHGFRHGHGYAYHGGGYDTGWVLLGGMLVGGLIGYAISEDRHRSRAYQPAPAYAPAYHSAPAYQPAPTYQPAPVYAPAAPARINTAYRGEFGGTCVMTREYTTTVSFEGRPHEAYGTRCMQADGSWVFGAPRLAPR